MTDATGATFFVSAAEFRAWLEQYGATTAELLVGFYKKASGTTGISYPEAVDEALCAGWIDGVRRSLDGARYTIRFTSRKPTSIWSAVNIARVAELTHQSRMRPAGLAAFAKRTEARSRVYSFEQEAHALSDEYEQRFRANAAAWAYFQAQAPSYQRTAIWWVVSAKQEATRLKRLATLIDDSAHGHRLKHLTYTPKGHA
jgi:uncharacterized protein YdeI (YjbR/CyaY-like superfamily)